MLDGIAFVIMLSIFSSYIQNFLDSYSTDWKKPTYFQTGRLLAANY